MNKIELLEELRKTDEISLLEVLEITSEDILDRFMDRVDENLGKLYQLLD
jgi:hypothetical protein